MIDTLEDVIEIGKFVLADTTFIAPKFCFSKYFYDRTNYKQFDLDQLNFILNSIPEKQVFLIRENLFITKEVCMELEKFQKIFIEKQCFLNEMERRSSKFNSRYCEEFEDEIPKIKKCFSDIGFMLNNFVKMARRSVLKFDHAKVHKLLFELVIEFSDVFGLKNIDKKPIFDSGAENEDLRGDESLIAAGIYFSAFGKKVSIVTWDKDLPRLLIGTYSSIVSYGSSRSLEKFCNMLKCHPIKLYQSTYGDNLNIYNSRYFASWPKLSGMGGEAVSNLTLKDIKKLENSINYFLNLMFNERRCE